ncbi:MAG TPA: transposase [Planctomicrobium sp.]|nr:transposase [Planctomicrobium sp.]
MDVATSFLPVLQVFAAEMTRPTFQTFLILVSGWLMAPRQTIIGMVRASGTDRHHAAFHRLFATATWSVDVVGLAVFDLVTAMRSMVFLTIDDTLIPRTGLKIFGTGMHREPMLSSRSHVVTRWGHCGVVLCVVLESRHFPGHHFSLSVLCRLYLNKTSALKWDRGYHKKSDLMLQLLQVLNKHVSGTGKNAFAGRFRFHRSGSAQPDAGRNAGDRTHHGQFPSA